MYQDNTTSTYEPQNAQQEDVTIEEAGSGIFPISGNIGERIFQKYNEMLKKEYRDYPFLQSLYKDTRGRLKNANPFIKVLLAPILQEENLALPRFMNLGMSLKYYPRELGSFTIDIGFVLRGNNDICRSNKVIEEDLIDQLKVLKGDLQFPVLLSLGGTRLKQYPGSRYNTLSFRLTKDTEIISAPILNQGGYFSPDELDENTCLPKTTRKERRQGDLELIVGKSGLCRAYISVFGDIDTETKDLGITDYSPVLAVKK